MTHIFVDVDGCIANSTERLKRAGKPPPNRLPQVKFDRWLDLVNDVQRMTEEKPVLGMISLVTAICYDSGTNPDINIYYLTSRNEAYRKLTYDWLKRNRFPTHIPLIMRAADDDDCYSKYKEKMIISQKLEDTDEVVVIDDDIEGKLEEVCKRNGWTLLKSRTGTI